MSLLPISPEQALINAIKSPQGLLGISLRDWDVLIRLAKRANLIGRLSEVLDLQGVRDELPASVKNHLESAQVLTAHQRQAIAWEARHIDKALKPLSVPIILLKGAAYAISDLAAARGRLFGDVDVLLPKDQMNQAEAALMVNGWGSSGSDPYDDRYYRRWMHELPPMAHRKRGTVIDVHHNILPMTARDCPSIELLLSASVAVPGTEFHVLCPCDMVIHSATHLFHEGELQNGLRDLFDLDALIGEFSSNLPCFWQDLSDRAETLGLSWPLYLALRYANVILDTQVPSDVNLRLAKLSEINPLSQKVLDAMYLRALKPDHPLCDDFLTQLARLGIFLRSHFLRMPVGLLTLHLGRKAVMRTFKNTSRSV